MSPRARFTELDGLRGVAAGSVVLYHLFHEYDVYFHPAGGPPPVQFSGGFYGVQLFFLISGFVILLTAQRSARPRDFVVARFTRLYPTYWACLTLSWLVVAGLGVASLQRSPFQIAVNYTMVQRLLGIRDVDGAYWSLSVELLFYALVLVLMTWRGGLPRRAVRGLVVGWLGVALAVAALVRVRPALPHLHVLQVLTAAEFAPLFAVGMLLLPLRGQGPAAALRDPLLVGSVVAAGVVTALLHDVGAAAVVVGLCLAFAAVVLAPGCAPLRARPLVFIGEISYPLYLVHQNVGYAVLTRLVGPLDRTLAALVALAIVIPLAWLLHVSVEGPLSHRLRSALLTRVGVPALAGRRGPSAT